MFTTKFLLTNLNCSACGKVSKIKISRIPDVTAVQIEQNNNEAQGELTALKDITINEIEQALAGTGYKVHAAK
jgi:cation transport ATPase